MAKKKTDKKIKLKPAMELFCKYYIGVHFNNASKAYARAYNFPLAEWDELDDLSETRRRELGKQQRWEELKTKYAGCRSSAAELLTKPNVKARVNELLLETFNENDVDAEHAFVIQQKGDLPSKIAAIREFNKLKGRITDRVKVQGTFSLSDILDEVDK